MGTIDFWGHTAIHAPPLSPLNTIDLGDLDKTISTNITATALLINFISPIISKEGKHYFLTTLAMEEVFWSVRIIKNCSNVIGSIMGK